MRSNLKVKPLRAYMVKIRLPNGIDRSPRLPMFFTHPCDAITYAWELHGRCKVTVKPA